MHLHSFILTCDICSPPGFVKHLYLHLGITLEVLTMIELNTSLNEKGCVTIAPE